MPTFAKLSRSLFWGILLLVALGVLPDNDARSGLAAQTPDVPVRRPPTSANPKLVKALETRCALFAGEADPDATLERILAKWTKASRIEVTIDSEAFRDEDLKDVAKIKVARREPLAPMKHVSFGTALKRILTRIPSRSGATYVLHHDRVEITTQTARLRNLGLPPDTRSPLIERTYRNVPLKKALHDLHSLAGGLVIDARVEKKADEVAVTAKLRHVPVETAIELLADMAGLTVVEVDGVKYVTSKDNAARMKEQLPRLLAAVDDSRQWPGAIGFRSTAFGDRAESVKKKLEGVADEADVTVLIDARAERQVQAMTTADVRGMSVVLALELLADMAGLGVARVRNTYYVTTPENADRLRKEELERLAAKKRDKK